MNVNKTELFAEINLTLKRCCYCRIIAIFKPYQHMKRYIDVFSKIICQSDLCKKRIAKFVI